MNFVLHDLRDAPDIRSMWVCLEIRTHSGSGCNKNKMFRCMSRRRQHYEIFYAKLFEASTEVWSNSVNRYNTNCCYVDIGGSNQVSGTNSQRSQVDLKFDVSSSDYLGKTMQAKFQSEKDLKSGLLKLH